MRFGFLSRQILVLFGVVILAVGILSAYKLQIANTNAYMGYINFDLGLGYFLLSAAGLIFVAWLIPYAVLRPSDFFCLSYGLFVLLPYVLLYEIRGEVGFSSFLIFLLALILPAVSVKYVSLIRLRFPIPVLLTERGLVNILIFICIVGVLHGVLNPPSSAGFDLIGSYERRIEGRDVFVVGSFFAYLNSAIVNGFAPFLAYIGGLRSRRMLLIISICCQISFFYLLGLKAPIAFSGLAFLIGGVVAKKAFNKVGVSIFFVIIFLLILPFVEWSFYEESLVAEIFVRRSFSVPPYLLSAYFEFMGSRATSDWSILFGSSSSGAISFQVGEGFLGFDGLNANTNSFVYQLASNGLVGYFANVFLVAIVFLVLNTINIKRRNGLAYYLGFSYAILITEQSATTALLSSGLGLLIFLVATCQDGESTIV